MWLRPEKPTGVIAERRVAEGAHGLPTWGEPTKMQEGELGRIFVALRAAEHLPDEHDVKPVAVVTEHRSLVSGRLG